MQITTFKFYLRKYLDPPGAWYYFYIDNTGTVQTTTTKTELPQSPKGWMESELKWERGFEWHGVFTNYSNPLQFVNDGALILRDIYYNTGVEGACQLLIEKHTNEVATFGHVEYYKGDIDFSRFKDMKDFVQVEIMEGGFLAELKAKQSTAYEIDVEQNPDVIWVKMDGLDLQASSEWLDLPNETIKDDLVTTFKVPTFLQYLPKGVSFYATMQDQLMLLQGDVANLIVNFSSVSQDITLEHTFNYNVDTITSDGHFGYLYAIVGPNSPSAISAINTYWIYQDLTGLLIGQSGTFTGSDTQTITIPSGLACRVVVGWFTDATFTSLNSSLSCNVDQLGSNIKMTLLNKYPESYIPAIRPLTLGQNVLDKITTGWTMNGDPMTDNDTYVLTSGDALRNLSNSKIKTSWEDMFKAYDCMWLCGFRQDISASDAYIEYRSYLYDSVSATKDLGSVKKLEISPLTQEMFSKLKIGYKPYNYDDFNGKEEPNTEYQFSTGLKRVQNEKNLVSPYRADMYGIELTRANLTDKVEADSDNDNEVFWLHIEGTPAGAVPDGPGVGQDYYELDRTANASITSGLISQTTAFNIELTPKRRMRTWGEYFKSVFYPNLSQVFTFTSSAKTIDGAGGLEWDDGVTVINEKDNEIMSGLPGSPLFYPLIFEIEVKVPLDPSDVFSTPYTRFTFEYKGHTLYGFLIEVTDKPALRSVQNYRLLCSTDNTLTDLIQLM